jgi:muramoyltetrapeptide carboxypeptidase LdcA involved in peptidoglycan recycling
MKYIVLTLLLFSITSCTSAPAKLSRLEEQKQRLQAAGFDVSYKKTN